MSSIYSKQFPQTISTSKTSKPDEPDFSVTNRLKKDIFCNGIEVVCSPEFTRKGAMIVEVDNVVRYDSRNTTGFLRIGKLPITLNAQMKRDVKVDIFIFNQVDSNNIECDVTVFLSEESKTLDSSMQYISDEVVNSLVSENEILFERRVYFEEEVTKLLDMKGYKKLILNMSASTVIDPILISSQIVSLDVSEYIINNSGNDFPTGGNGTFGHNISGLIPSPFPKQIPSRTILGASLDEEQLSETVYDFLETENHILDFSLSNLPITIKNSFSSFLDNSSNFELNFNRYIVTLSEIRVEESDNPASGFSLVSDFSGDESGNVNRASITKRYVKIIIKHKVYSHFEFSTFNVGISGPTDTRTISASSESVDSIDFISSVIDGIKKGGTADLSFEELDISDGNFSVLIPSSEFGTISEGQSVKRQLGDTSNIAQSGKTYILPSTQTGFRAKLVISGGGIETGVSIRKIA